MIEFDIDKVKSRYPLAVIESYDMGHMYCVWDRPNSDTESRALKGVGTTPALAWSDAVQTIDIQLGKRL